MAGGSLAGINGISHGAADAITHLLKSNVECILPMEIVCGMGYMWGKALNESLRLTAQMYQNRLSLSLFFRTIVSRSVSSCATKAYKGLLEQGYLQRHTPDINVPSLIVKQLQYLDRGTSQHRCRCANAFL
jgi:hypothetical protein